MRDSIARLSPGSRRRPVISLDPEIDAALPAGGLALGGLHDVAGAGPEVEHAAAAALFAAAAVGRSPVRDGMVLWIAPCAAFAPALAGVGLHPDRVIHVEAPRPAAVLRAMEDALGHAELAGVVGELSGALGLTASRRLQLAAERSGAVAFLLRRSRCFDDAALREPSAALTSWRIASVPSAPPLADATVPGLGGARWRLDLVRCRGGEAASWIREAPDATGGLGIPADLADRPAAPGTRAAA